MEELFGLSMTTLMYILLGVVLASIAGLLVLAVRNKIMLKMGLRPIPRRPGQTGLIILGVMLSTVIMAAAFGTGDTLSFSIRNEALMGLQHIDELVIPIRAGEYDKFGSLYIDQARFNEIRDELSSNEQIDGITPQVSEKIPVQNLRTKLSEGQMNLVGLDPTQLEGFGDLFLVDGGTALLDDLDDGEAYISKQGIEEIEGRIGDEIIVFLEGETQVLKIKNILNRGGFAGIDPTMVVPLEMAQQLVGRPGQINTIVISNEGDERSGSKLTKEVTQDLRALFNDREISTRLKELFNQEPVITALEKKIAEKATNNKLKDDLTEFVTELRKPGLTDGLNSLLADRDLTRVVLEQVEADEIEGIGEEAFTLFSDLSEFRVIKVKQDILDAAEAAGSGATSIFILFSSFSITVGILLIFLIFVMLAAARKSEMGMARAIGAKRRHLVMMFAFEGTAYASVSAAIGVALGLGVSMLMVTVLNQIFSDIEEDFILTIHFEPRSVVVAYCLGMAITFATVAISAYRVSRLNIVVAIRGLPEAIIPKSDATFRDRLFDLLRALIMPGYYFFKSFRFLYQRRFKEFARNFGLAFVVIFPVWLISISVCLLKFIQPYLLRGWLVFISGVVITYFAIDQWERVSWFGAGVSLTIVGLGFMLRWGLTGTNTQTDLVDRISFTITGITMLVFWALPFDFFEPLVGDLEGGFDIMFVSGIAMVGACVWTVMYNADLLVRVLTFLTTRVGKLRPVLVTAVAYPMSSKFRTGLTLAMFALVIFTLIIMSVLTTTFTTQFESSRKIYMGFDVGGSININSPIKDIAGSIDLVPDIEPSDFEAVGGYTLVGLELRQLEGESGRWFRRTGMLLDQEFLRTSDIDFKLIAEGYGPTSSDVLDSMRADPSLAIVGGWMLPNENELEREEDDPRLFGDLHYDSSSMNPISIEIREPRTGAQVQAKVIGIYERVHANAFRIIGSKTLVDGLVPFEIPLTDYRFKLTEGVDQKDIAQSLEVAFIENGMQTEVFQETIDEETSAGQAFFRLFTAFMALGLFVGVAALGVISTRAVVERRQQIGVLRAIGYKRGMISLSFLLEASFVSLLGSVIGLGLGLLLSYHAVNSIRDDAGIAGITFAVPWLQIGFILAITYGFSLLTTFLPARQASRIYPAEALRYE